MVNSLSLCVKKQKETTTASKLVIDEQTIEQIYVLKKKLQYRKKTIFQIIYRSKICLSLVKKEVRNQYVHAHVLRLSKLIFRTYTCECR